MLYECGYDMFLIEIIHAHIMEGNPATVYLPFHAKRTGRYEGRGKVMMAEVTLHELAPGKEEGDEEAEEFVSEEGKEEEEKPAKKAKLDW